jgi:hypothetical protein
VIGLVTGCFLPAPAPHERLAGLAAANLYHGPALSGRAAVDKLAAEGKAVFGTIRLVIGWPLGPGRDLRGYHAQLIPDSTARIKIEVKSGGQTIAGEVVTRQAGVATVSATIPVRAYSNMSVRATAEASGGEVIAVGHAAGVNVSKGRTTAVPLVMTNLYIPEIETLSANTGIAGDRIILSGRNLSTTWAAPPSVTLFGSQASVSALVSGVSVSSMSVTIPQGARTGRIVVSVDGVESYSNAIYWVAGALSLTAPKESWDTSPSDERITMFDSLQSFGATPTWVLQEGRTEQDYGNPPQPAWSNGNPEVGDLANQTGSENVLETTDVRGETQIAAKLGGLVSQAIRVSNRPVGPFGDAGVQLGTARNGAAVARVASSLYVLGGENQGPSPIDSIERAAINDVGDLGPLQGAGIALTTARHGASALVLGNYVYVMGGRSDVQSYKKSIERAAIDGRGDLEPFQAYPQADLLVPRYLFQVVQAGRFVYALGGSNAEGPMNSVVRAPILNGQGDLGAFEDYTQVAGMAPLATFLGINLGPELLVMGGQTSQGAPYLRVDRAYFDKAGNLGAFEDTGRRLAEARVAGGAFFRDFIALLGGGTDPGGDPTATGEVARLGENRSLSTFAGEALGISPPRFDCPSFVTGPWVYLVGGAGATVNGTRTRLNSVVRARISVAGDAAASVEVR